MSTIVESLANSRNDLPLSVPSAAGAVQAAPEPPLTILEPRSGWELVNLEELWRYRELLVFLAWRDVKVRYKQTVLGAAWAILQPLATMAVFAVILGRVAGIQTGDVPYPLFAFVGLLAWNLFSNAITSAGQSLIGNQNLVTKVYFPRLLIPISAAGVGLVDFCVAAALLVILMGYYAIAPGIGVFLAPVIILLLLVTAIGVGTLLAALTVAYRDFRYVVPFAVQLWMFATATIYLPVETMIGPRGRLLLPLNPVHGFIYNFRQAVLGGPIDWYALGVSTAVGLVLLVIGCLYFRRVERDFADVI